MCVFLFLYRIFSFVIGLIVLTRTGYSKETYAGANEIYTSLLPAGIKGNLSCFPKENNKTVQKLKGSVYLWSYEGDKTISFGKPNSKTGTFQFSPVQPQAGGHYTCTVKGKLMAKNNNTKGANGTTRSTSNHVKQYFKHRLIVYKMPVIHIIFLRYFLVPRCLPNLDKKFMSKFTEVLCSQIRQPCPYSIHFECSESPKKKKIGKAFARPSNPLNMMVEIRNPNFIPPSCDAVCIRKSFDAQIKWLQLRVKTQWSKVFQDDPDLLYWYRQAPRPERLIVNEDCPPGFIYFRESICVPCEPGYHWSERQDRCTACPIDTFSDHGGAVACKECPTNSFSFDVATKNLKGCIFKKRPMTSNFLVVAVGVPLFIILLLLQICGNLLLSRKISNQGGGGRSANDRHVKVTIDETPDKKTRVDIRRE